MENLYVVDEEYGQIVSDVTRLDICLDIIEQLENRVVQEELVHVISNKQQDLLESKDAPVTLEEYLNE